MLQRLEITGKPTPWLPGVYRGTERTDPIVSFKAEFQRQQSLSNTGQRSTMQKHPSNCYPNMKTKVKKKLW